MNLFLYLIILGLGLAVGSFLNCIIHRLHTGEKFLFDRSYCPSCRHRLGFWDLIPIFSFLFLKGKCRYCQKSISWQYPLVELSTATLFLFPVICNYITVYSFIDLVFYWIFSCFLIVIFVYDFKHYLIPDQVIYPAIAIALIYQFFKIWNFSILPENWDFLRISSLGLGILPSLFFLVLILGSKQKWMGFGDFKLAIWMGLILGWPNILVALFLAFFIGAIIGIGLIIFGKKTLKSEIPFGPFLVTGTFIALFFGEKIVNWYLNLLAI